MWSDLRQPSSLHAVLGSLVVVLIQRTLEKTGSILWTELCLLSISLIYSTYSVASSHKKQFPVWVQWWEKNQTLIYFQEAATSEDENASHNSQGKKQSALRIPLRARRRKWQRSSITKTQQTPKTERQLFSTERSLVKHMFMNSARHQPVDPDKTAQVFCCIKMQNDGWFHACTGWDVFLPFLWHLYLSLPTLLPLTKEHALAAWHFSWALDSQSF